MIYLKKRILILIIYYKVVYSAISDYLENTF